MSPKLWMAALLLAFSLNSLAAPTFVQKSASATGGSTSVRATLTNKAGDLLVAYVIWDNTGSATIADSLHNTYSPASAAVKWNGGRASAQVFYAKNIVAGRNSVTATFGTKTSNWGLVYLAEYSGVDTTSPFDGTIASSGTSGSLNSGSATAALNDLLVGAGVSSNTVTGAGSGFTLRSTDFGNVMEDRVATAAGAYSATANQNGSAWAMQLVAFRAAGTTTTPPPNNPPPNNPPPNNPPPSDTQAPSSPAGLQATNVTYNSVTLAWGASQDNVGVTGYKITRNDGHSGTSTTTAYTDSTVSAQTSYNYNVVAMDAAGNSSSPSPALTVTTPAAPSSGSGPAYPLKQSANKRYLVDQNGKPTMLVGDSPHSLFVNLSESDADFYFANRQKYGTNIVWIEILCDEYTGGRSNGATYDGIVPLTTANKLSTPNPAYFQRVDDMIRLAANHNITVLLDTIDTAGYRTALDNASTSEAYNYGVYLGTRYKSFPNILWITGNDFRSWGQDTAGNNNAAQIMKGVQDSDPNHLQTTELTDSVSGSLDDPQLVPYTTLAAAYTYYPTYAEVLTEYNAAAGKMPVFMEEADYEFAPAVDNDGTPATLRRQEYWTMLSGATGQMYGNYYTYPFSGPESPVNGQWKNYLDTPGSTQLKIMTDFFNTYSWWNLVPDQNHQFVTAGYGTYSSSGNVKSSNYVTAGISSGGDLGMAYVPGGGSITVAMSKFAGAVNAQWFDPSNGTYRSAGSQLSNSGSQQFSTPGNNSAGDRDWVLVLATN